MSLSVKAAVFITITTLIIIIIIIISSSSGSSIISSINIRIRLFRCSFMSLSMKAAEEQGRGPRARLSLYNDINNINNNNNNNRYQ